MNTETKQGILSDIDAGMTHRQIAESRGVGVSTVSRIRNARPAIAPTEQIKPQFGELPKHQRSSLDMLRAAITRSSSHAVDPDYRKITIAANQPIAIMKASDLHFGGLDVDYESLLAHCQFLLDAPNFYLQLFGDDINMMVMHRMVGARHDGFTPEEQINWLENFVHEMLERGKLVSMASGNHSDEFTEKNAGFGIVRAVMKYKVPYFRGIGYIDLVVGDQTYPMGFVHKTRFSSFMNPVHGNKRMEQQHPKLFGLNRLPCREYITAHTHNPAMATEGCLPHERTHYIKCGTFKTNCLFSQRYFGQGRIGVPTVVYHPDRLEHILFPTPWEAYRYMHGTDYKEI